MPTYITIRRVSHDGYLYAIGETIELTKEQAASLIESGVITPCYTPPPQVAPTPPEIESPPPNPPIDSETPSTEEVNLDQSVDPVLVNVNTATSLELQAMEFVGPAIAKRIIDKRPYETLEEVESAAKMSPDQWTVVKKKLSL